MNEEKESYDGDEEGEEVEVVSPSYTVIDPLAMMIAAFDTIVAL